MKQMRAFVHLIVVVALALISCSCGRLSHIKGRVVAVPQLGAQESLIMEFTGKSLPQGGQPLAGARVSVLYNVEQNGQPSAAGTSVSEATTDEKGNFEVRGYDAPYRDAKLGLLVKKEGYQEVYMAYTDYRAVEPQVFLVVLIPAGASQDAVKTTAH